MGPEKDLWEGTEGEGTSLRHEARQVPQEEGTPRP